MSWSHAGPMFGAGPKGPHKANGQMGAKAPRPPRGPKGPHGPHGTMGLSIITCAKMSLSGFMGHGAGLRCVCAREQHVAHMIHKFMIQTQREPAWRTARGRERKGIIGIGATPCWRRSASEAAERKATNVHCTQQTAFMACANAMSALPGSHANG